jgi:stearoyl-CoA desaturase (delta-9 desaturase)
MKLDATTAQERDAPIYNSFTELKADGFSLSPGICVFIAGVHTAALVLGVWLFAAAPADWMWAGTAWLIAHFLLGSLSTTLYSHRLITHNAAKHVSLPVHLFFNLFGQIFSVQGSVRRWAANHSLHHGVDRHGKKELDPYSATWFPDSLRNFLWSHTLTHLYNHPETEEYKRSHNAKRHPVIMWQDKWYGLLTTFWIFFFPMGLGFALGGFTGLFALAGGSMLGTVAVQHNTWTVNSVTHIWGVTPGIKSSASNNYVWLGPLGEGNHHGDHHDYPRDYRNGFGISGWLLDPTRYAILTLRALGLVRGLNRASKHEEAEIIAQRKLQELGMFEPISREAAALREQLEKTAVVLKQEWVEALAHVEKLKKQSKLLQRAEAGRQEILRELELAQQAVAKRKEAFYRAVEQLRNHAEVYA